VYVIELLIVKLGYVTCII